MTFDLSLGPERIIVSNVGHHFANNQGDQVRVRALSQFEAVDELPGGQLTMSGVIAESEWSDHPNAFDYGSNWTVSSNGETWFRGRLLDPAPDSGGKVTIRAMGAGNLADKLTQRILFQTRSLEDWSPADQDPFNYKADEKFERVEGSAFGGAGSSADGERVFNSGEKGQSVTYNIGAEVDDNEAYEVQVYGRKVETGSGYAYVYVGIYDATAGAWVRRIRKKITAEDNPSEMAVFPFRKTDGHTYQVRVTWRDDIKKKGGQDQTNVRPVVSHFKFGKTNNVTSDKIQAEIRGKRMVFTVPRSTRFFGGEATALLFWAFEQDLRRVAFTIDKADDNDNFVLDILVGRELNDDLTKVETIALNEDGPTYVDKRISGGDYQMVGIRLRRKEDAAEKKEKRWSVTLMDVRVGAVAITDEYTPSQVAREVARRMEVGIGQIEPTEFNILPLDFREGTYGDLLTQVAAVLGWRWRIRNRGNGPELDFGPWDSRTWKSIEQETEYSLVPMDRYTAVRVPFRGDGGQMDWVIVRARQDLVPPKPENIFDVPLDDPLPSKDVSRHLGEILADRLARPKWGGSARLARVDRAGDHDFRRTTGHRVRAGDTLVIPSHDIRLRIKTVRHTESMVELTFDESHLSVDKLLARRTQMLARGIGPDNATLQAAGVDRPYEPEGVTVEFGVREVRGEVLFWGASKWDAVIEDVKGYPAEVVSYHAQFRPVVPVTDVASLPGVNSPDYRDGDVVRRTTDNTFWYLDDDRSAWRSFERSVWVAPEGARWAVPVNGKMEEKVKKLKDNSDSAEDPDNLKLFFGTIDRPKRWWFQTRVMATDEYGRDSDYSDWTEPAQPTDDPQVLPPTPVHLGGPNALHATVDTGELARDDYYRIRLRCDEIRNWDVPGGDTQSDLGAYECEIRRVTVTGTTVTDVLEGGQPVYRRQTRRASLQSDDDNSYVLFAFKRLNTRHLWKARVRSVSKWGTPSEWSAWEDTLVESFQHPDVAWVIKIDAPPGDPTEVDTLMGEGRVGADWEPPIAPSETDFADDRVDYFQAQCIRVAGGTAEVTVEAKWDSIGNFDDVDLFRKSKYIKNTRIQWNSDNWDDDHYVRVRSVDKDRQTSEWVYAGAPFPGAPVRPREIVEVPPFAYTGELTTFDAPHRYYINSGEYEIKKVRLAVGTAPTGQAIIVQIKINGGAGAGGTNLFSTSPTDQRPKIAAGTNTQVVNVDPVVPISAGAYITVDIRQVGSGTKGSDLTVQIYMRKIS